MFKKKIILLLSLVILITSCDSMRSVKRGLTGEKRYSTDEFLVQKKDPLILPPNFDSLPTPSDREEAVEEILSLEEKLTKTSSTESTSSATGSTEQSILQQIKKK